MRLAHRRRDGLAPFAIEIAEAAVTVTVRLLRAVLLPQQHQRDAAPLHLLVHLAPIDAARGGPVSHGIGKRRRSSSASSIASGTGQVMPITRARRTYSPITVLPTPVASLICRKLIPSVCLSRNTSRTLRIDNLSAGIRNPSR